MTKTLTQEDFKGTPDWVKSAAVDDDGHVWLSLVEAETYIDESKILAWQPMSMPNDEFFESLEVDWVQDAKANN